MTSTSKSSLIIPHINSLDSFITSEPTADFANADAITAILDSEGIRQTINHCNWAEAYPYRPLATFSAAHSDKYLYIDFLVRCNYLRAVNANDLEPVAEDSCVEVFLRSKPDGEYFNFEFNCIGTLNASHRLERPKPTRLTPEQLKTVLRAPSVGNRPFCEIEGLFTWNLLIAIPLDLIGVDASKFPVEIEGNFYKCAGATSSPHFLSWAPIDTPKPDFHRPEFFGKIILA